jgi:hypothetical protein
MAVVILLTVATVTLYAVYWLTVTTRSLNRELPRHRISGWFTGTALAMAVLFATWFLLDVLELYQGPFRDALPLIDPLYYGAVMVWTLRVRDRLHLALRQMPGDSGWARAFLSWLLGPAYLQWKVNRALRLSQIAGSSAGAGPFLWRPLRRRGWALAVLPMAAPLLVFAAIGLLGVGALISGKLMYRLSEVGVEKRLGAVSRFAFRLDSIGELASIGRLVDLSPEERSFVRELVDSGPCDASVQHGREIRAILARNEAALALLSGQLAGPA